VASVRPSDTASTGITGPRGSSKSSFLVGEEGGYFLEPTVRADMVAQVVIEHYSSGSRWAAGSS
jgi:hypothetical protein